MNIPAGLRAFAEQAYAAVSSAMTAPAPPPTGGGSFAFGDPEPVLASSLVDYLGIFADFGGRYYSPPVSLEGLARIEGANSQHGPILRFKANMVGKWFKETSVLSRSEILKAALDYHMFGMCYFQIIRNRLGGILRLERRPALMMRRGIQPGTFYELRSNLNWADPLEYQPGEIIQLMETDVRQTIYGIPGYFGGIQAVLLSEDATLFRRKFYKNGAHLGYILVTQDAGIDADSAKLLEEKIKAGTGPGNWRSLYLNIKRTQAREPVKVIPIGEIGNKDDFEKVKGITREELLAMHRMQPGICGIIPDNITGFGDLEKVMRVYHELEVIPMQHVFLGLNTILPAGQQIRFADPIWSTTA